MNDRELYRDAIALQPGALTSCIEAVSTRLETLDVQPIKEGPVVLAGIGASLYAAIVAAAQMRSQGLRAFALAGTDLYDPAIDAGKAYIAFSASGRSEEPARAMELRPQAETYGIAKADGTPISRVVKHMIPTNSGADSGPNTTSYLGSLMTAALLADKAGRSSNADWHELPALAAQVLEQSRPQADKAARLLAGKRSIDCVGAGCAYGTAGYAALLIREAARVAAQDWDTLNFLHGPMEPNDSRSGVILFGDSREVKLAVDLAGFGIPSVLITTRTDVSDAENLVVITVPSFSTEIGNAILQAIPVQLLTATLSEDAGLPVCNFRYRQTDTKRDI
ncbi:phosphosugar isomerase (plasmid) [Agrobacterium sp. 33MFTa1.1]|uniref:SIS domain-containing protein n=1 Tax=Agrobacterium sp. 33MFTa1.1 TaxID=1279031 RepID=UPI0005505156|nr:phosphosugar isomerase [Agrobacterium sp. 33MFTa1.1]QBJ16434.1 phosphosugar isomerase [Agrobacterium sp. 33MFTa1.1]